MSDHVDTIRRTLSQLKLLDLPVPLRDEVWAIEPELDALQIELGRKDAALHDAEWKGAAWIGFECCPVCGNERAEGHKPGCSIGTVVANVSPQVDTVSDRDDAGTTSPRAVFRFGLGEEGARWNWPVDGHDGIDAFREILTLAGIDFDEVAGPSSVAAAEGEREIVTAEAALEMLDVIEDYDAGSGPEQCVHTYRQGVAGILLGAHWSLEKAKTAIAEHGVELAGPVMTRMGHGLVLEDATGAVFLATKETA